MNRISIIIEYLEENPLLALEFRYRYLEYLRKIEAVRQEIQTIRDSQDPYYQLQWSASDI